MVLLIVGLLVITVAIGGIFVFAQPAAPPVPTQGSGTKTGPTGGAFPTAHTSMPKPTATRPAAVTSTPPPSIQGTQGTGMQPVAGLPSLALLDQLGWTHAGLSLADAIEAERTATTFVDREMSYDYRTIGTPDQHGGSLTNSTFLLTPGAQVRFIHHDVRMINNTLYNTIRDGKIIQQVVDAQAMLVTFQVITIGGQEHSFAWLSVSFELVRSSIDPATGKRVEGIEQERASGQPRIHHMSVVLMRVAPQTQGTGAPMGGTGWLVNIYALDATTLPAIATTPAL
jgi:hypothetical protein